MSQKTATNIAPALAADIIPIWIAQVRAAIQRDGHAIRAGSPAITIEAQSINRPEIWCAINLPSNTTLFATEQDRDLVLDQLVGKSK